MKKVSILTCFFLIIFSSTHAQIDSASLWQRAIFDSTANFDQIFQAQQSFFAVHRDSAQGESGKRSEFYRWANFWKTRVDRSDGQSSSIFKAIKKYHNLYDQLATVSNSPSNPSLDWYYLGPKNLKTQNYGIVSCVRIDPSDPTHQTYYAGSGTSGLWKTTDGGQTWANITGLYISYGMGVMDILINPGNSKIIYIATNCGSMGRSFIYGNGILKTTDGGNTWSKSLDIQPESMQPITKMIMDPTDNNKIVAFGKHYIYRTTDGQNWNRIDSEPNMPLEYCLSDRNWITPKIVRDAFFVPGSSSSVYVATDMGGGYSAELWKINNIFSTAISSSDFIKLSNQLSTNYYRFSLDVKPGNSTSGIVYCGGLTANDFQIFRIDPQTFTLTPYCTVTPIHNLSESQCEFKMSELVDSSFILCDHYFHYYQYPKATSVNNSLLYCNYENPFDIAVDCPDCFPFRAMSAIFQQTL